MRVLKVSCCFLLVFVSSWLFADHSNSLPSGFVYLSDVSPSIIQDMRYAGNHNFIDGPITGYKKPVCILTKQAAEALAQLQNELLASNLSLKVYDCYRPQSAVNEFIAWSKQMNQQQMKGEFYPRVNKADFFKLGYVAVRSGHTRGSTMDLTIVALPAKPEAPYQAGQKLTACYAPYHERYQDNSIDMGTGFDCMDKTAHNDNNEIGLVPYHNRQLLKDLMLKYGFIPLHEEWWHFTLKNEPYPNTYFYFTVQ